MAFDGNVIPQKLFLIVLLDKLDCVRGISFTGGQLCDDTDRNLSATLISHEDSIPVILQSAEFKIAL